MRARVIIVLSLALATAAVSGCAGYRARENLRHGLVTLELTQQDVLEVWNLPTHTVAMSGDEIIKSGIAGWGGFFFKGREMYELWEYEPRQAQLVFYSQKLVAWKTDQTVQTLSTPKRDDRFWP